MTDAHQFGRESEAAAERFLTRTGYRIVTRNYRCAGAEIDMIAYDGPTLVFVEVKARRSQRFGSAPESVDRKKQRQLTKAALSYLSRAGGRASELSCRFDLVVIDASPAGRQAPSRVEVLRDAFSPSWGAL